ncbi:hypothetical protein C0991_003559 [Blastosporella zonata]|nr:hypothetical protein C0991_003559 [Blastosporella zonata]
MSEEKPSENASSAPASPGPSSTAATQVAPDRSELLSRARGFLQSPQIIHQDIAAKRKFLVEKGLNETEIDVLLRELPLPRPNIPPRAYPQPPPSHLPTLILGITRVFSWIAGGSAALIFIYYRFLLPRITQTALARRSLKTHHLSLLGRLNESLESLKKSQTEAYSVLPSPDPSREEPKFQACHTIADILRIVGNKEIDLQSIPPITLIRCSVEGFGKGKESEASQPTTEDLFRYMEGQIPWLVSEEGQKYEVRKTLLLSALGSQWLFDAAKALGNTLHFLLIYRHFVCDTRHGKPEAHSLGIQHTFSGGTFSNPNINEALDDISSKEF